MSRNQLAVAVLVLIALCSEVCAQPASDAHKWYLTVFTRQDCHACRALKQDFSTRHLRPWASWAHLNFIDLDRASQAQRALAYKVSPRGAVPTIVLTPPRNHPKYPYYIVFRQTGYSGDERKLAHDLYRMTTAFMKSVDETPRNGASTSNYHGRLLQRIRDRLRFPCPCPDCTPQLTPTPSVPVVPDYPDNPLPVIPDITPDDLDPPAPDDEELPDAVPLGGIPEYPQVTVIVDPDGLGEEAQLDCLKRIATELVHQYGFTSPKGRLLTVGSADAQTFPARAGDAPAIFITNQSKILAAISRPAVLMLIERLCGETTEAEPSGATPCDEFLPSIMQQLDARLDSLSLSMKADITAQVLEQLKNHPEPPAELTAELLQQIDDQLPPFYPQWIDEDNEVVDAIPGGVRLGQTLPLKLKVLLEAARDARPN